MPRLRFGLWYRETSKRCPSPQLILTQLKWTPFYSPKGLDFCLRFASLESIQIPFVLINIQPIWLINESNCCEIHVYRDFLVTECCGTEEFFHFLTGMEVILIVKVGKVENLTHDWLRSIVRLWNYKTTPEFYFRYDDRRIKKTKVSNHEDEIFKSMDCAQITFLEELTKNLFCPTSYPCTVYNI